MFIDRLSKHCRYNTMYVPLFEAYCDFGLEENLSVYRTKFIKVKLN